MPWFRIANVKEDEGQKTARLDIYDRIGETYDWWHDENVGIAASDFSATLQALGEVSAIELHINSPGGSVVEGLQIYNELKRHSATITVVVDAQAASIASVIAMAGDTIIMPQNTSLFVHNPVAFLHQCMSGDSDDWRKQAQKMFNLAETLDTIEAQVINTYLAKAGDKITAEKLKQLMDKDTTITAEQALAYGLCDQVEDALEAVACGDMPAELAKAQAQLQNRLQQQPPEAKDDPSPDIPAAMAAKAVITACKTAGLESLATTFIDQNATENQVTDQLALAKDINDMAVAGQVSHLTSALINAAMQGPLAAMRTALTIRLANDDPDIDGSLSQDAPIAVIDVQKIYAQRQQANQRPRGHL